MPNASIEVELSEALVGRIDALVRAGPFRSRSAFIEHALTVQLANFRRERLSAAAAQLDPVEERALAEEGINGDRAAWPAY